MALRNIGVPVNPPKKGCDDKACPFHGQMSIRGKILTGRVYNTRMESTITVERSYLHYVKKYMRYEKRRSRILAHKPPCIEVNVGDPVRIAECRPISKNVSFVVLEKLEK
jgi:small subunit ribosomal protein S17